MRIIKSLFCVCAALLMGFALRAQGPGPAVPESPELEFVLELHVTCDPGFTVGEHQHGNRFVIPITGGTFEGPAPIISCRTANTAAPSWTPSTASRRTTASTSMSATGVSP